MVTDGAEAASANELASMVSPTGDATPICTGHGIGGSLELRTRKIRLVILAPSSIRQIRAVKSRKEPGLGRDYVTYPVLAWRATGSKTSHDWSVGRP